LLGPISTQESSGQKGRIFESRKRKSALAKGEKPEKMWGPGLRSAWSSPEGKYWGKGGGAQKKKPARLGGTGHAKRHREGPPPSQPGVRKKKESSWENPGGGDPRHREGKEF